MKSDSLKEYVRLRNELTGERSRIQQRLSQINGALGGIPTPSLSLIDGATTSRAELAGSARGAARKKSKARGRMSPEARARIAAAARERWAKAKAAGQNKL